VRRRLPSTVTGILLLALVVVAWSVRIEVQVQYLGFHSWVSELMDPDFDERMARLERILETGDRTQTPWLVQVIYHDSSWKTRKWAEMALARVEGAQATPILVDLLLHAPLWRDRVKPAELLGKYGDRTCVPALIRQLNDYDFLVRYWCAKSLGKLREASAVPHLVRMLHEDPEAYPRSGAALALGEIGDPVAWPHLIRALQDDQADVRRYAVQALGKSGHPGAGPAIMLLVEDPDPEVRQQVCQALETLVEVRGRSALERLREDADPRVQFRARKALKALEGRASPPTWSPPPAARGVEDF